MLHHRVSASSKPSAPISFIVSEFVVCQFVSLHEGVDTLTPNGRLVFGIFASIAEFECELIRERVRSGIAIARAQGKHIGRPRRPVDGVRVAELRAQERSWAAIAREMGAGLGRVRRAGQPQNS